MTDGYKATDLRQKPPTEEDSFFAREDMERIELLREERRKREEHEGAEALRKQHYMCCPKCGNGLTEQEEGGVLVDRCAKCQGIWLDAGELEALAKKVRGGLGDSLFGWLG